MSTAASAPTPVPARGTFARHSYFWRRVHSLTGIIPIGAFIVEHFASNAAVLSHNPAQSYGNQVIFLNSLPFVLGLEIVLIWAPLAFHGLYGLWIARQADPNNRRYGWAANWGYLFQRISGVIVLVFIIWHTWTARFAGIYVPNHPYLAYAKMAAEMANPWILAWFIVGITLVSYHFAYGLYIFAAKWGITVTRVARANWGWICLIIGLGLTYAGIASALAFRGLYIYPIR
ncbi:MAG: succinate dehydrogenase [Terriglobales bacterium]